MITVRKYAQGAPTSASITEPQNPNHHTQPIQRQGAMSRLCHRLLALTLAVVLGVAGLFNNVRPVAAVGASGGTVGAGLNISCAVVNGGVKCWGSSGGGLVPTDVSGLTSGVATLSVGTTHACAVTTSGAAKCWGYNGHGQLGDGTTTSPSTPVNVSGLTSGVVSISAGSNFTCALTSSGGVKCWGGNASGNLGDGTTTERTTPVDVSGLTSGVVAISAGYSIACAVTSSGGAKCWGANTYGSLGDGTTTNRTTPVDVSGLTSGVVSIAAGHQNVCAVTSSGGVKCWGYNGLGTLGNGSTDGLSHPVPVSVPITGNAVFVNAGSDTACAVMDDGTAQCWGDDAQGKAGIGYVVTGYFTLPRDVVGGGFISIDTGGTQSCAATTTGVRCTGSYAGLADTPEAGTTVYAFVGVSGLGSSGVGIAPTPGTTDLAVTKTASVSSATPGTPFDYTITVTNNGSVTATNVNIKDNLPANVTYNSATPGGSGSCGAPSGGVLTCTWPSVAAGASVNVVINVTP